MISRKLKLTKRAFIPELDITTYELAQIFASIYPSIPPMAGIDFLDEVWNPLPDSIKRHFKEMDQL